MIPPPRARRPGPFALRRRTAADPDGGGGLLRTWHGIAIVFGFAALGVGFEVFGPEPDTLLEQDFPSLDTTTAAPGPAGDARPEPLRSGAFVGADSFHFATGTVALHQAANGTHVLRFEDYDARDGPDVYLYLTEEAGASSRAAVEGRGFRLLVPGGASGGQATVRGDFNLWLPPGLDVDRHDGVTIWCDGFDEFFGHAPLTA